MSDNTLKAILAICGVLSTGMTVLLALVQRKVASNQAENNRAQNQVLSAVYEQHTGETLPPPVDRPRRRGRALVATPLSVPILKHKGVVPEPIDTERSSKHKGDE